MWTKKLWTAIRRSDAVGVERAIRKGANVNVLDLDWPPLTFACERGYDEIARILFNAGADVWWKNDNDWSAMFAAVEEGHLSIVEMLLNHDHDLLEIADGYGQTPLVSAANRGRVDVVRFLLDRGANIHAAKQGSRPVLMVACFRGNIDIVRLLLAAGVDVDARDSKQETALHISAEYGRVQCLRELILQHNANLFAVDNDGTTPFDLACRWQRGRGPADLLLEMYGNKMSADHGRLALHKILITAEYTYPENRSFRPPLNPLRIKLPLGTLIVQHWRTLLQVLEMELSGNRDDSGKLPIHVACRANAPMEVLTELVDLDAATLQIADHSGNLPLHDCCCGAVNHSSVRYVVEQGGVGTLAARNRQGLLPLHVLCGSTNPPLRTVQYFIQSFSGAVAVPTKEGLYPFMMMAICKTSTASLSVAYELVRANPGLVVPR